MNVKIDVISNREIFEQAAQQAIEKAMEQCVLLAQNGSSEYVGMLVLSEH